MGPIRYDALVDEPVRRQRGTRVEFSAPERQSGFTKVVKVETGAVVGGAGTMAPVARLDISYPRQGALIDVRVSGGTVEIGEPNSVDADSVARQARSKARDRAP